MSEAEEEREFCFIDSNIWLYALIRSQDTAKSECAQRLIRERQSVAIISTQVIAEVCANLVRKDRLPEAKIRTLIRSFYRRYPVIGLDHDVQIAASRLRGRHSVSFWDSLILAAAIHGALRLSTPRICNLA
jgi:predicted nucleic acid-binding protein